MKPYLHCAPVLDSILPDKDVGHSALLEDGVLLANLFGKPSFLLLTENYRYYISSPCFISLTRKILYPGMSMVFALRISGYIKSP